MENFSNLAFGVLEIAADSGLSRTGMYAGSQFAAVNAMIAQGALVGGTGWMRDISATVRTGLHTIPTTYTMFLIDQDNAIGRVKSRPHRAQAVSQYMMRTESMVAKGMIK